MLLESLIGHTPQKSQISYLPFGNGPNRRLFMMAIGLTFYYKNGLISLTQE